MSLRKQVKILGISPAHLSRMVNGIHPWKPDIYDRYRELTASVNGNSVNTFVNTIGNTQQKLDNKSSHLVTAHSSSGLGHRPLKAEITGSNPVCATKQ